uniref:Uncharacterized protein n=1 Tax=Panagrolaimus sp. JU765 TaxID=591449 RepID=A0AC34Q3K3_9BILA
MGWKDPRDPRDPWAWRNTWTGEARTDYAELWIVIPIIVILVILAILALIPIFVHMYCRSACPFPGFWLFFDRFLQVLHELGNKTQRNDPSSFTNPAFDPEFGKNDKQSGKENAKSTHSKRTNQQVDDRMNHLRHSVKYSKPNRSNKPISRSKSCPGRPIVPKIKL